MRSVENYLYRAFNPSCELFASSPLGWDVGDNEDGLTQAERIADDSRIRATLENTLSDQDYRTLKLYFTDTNDIHTTQLVFEPIKGKLVAESKIAASTVSPLFIDLCAISEFWDSNLLKHDGEHGGLKKYGNVFTNCRRRKRIQAVLKQWRIVAMGKAKNVIRETYPPEDNAATA